MPFLCKSISCLKTFKCFKLSLRFIRCTSYHFVYVLLVIRRLSYKIINLFLMSINTPMNPDLHLYGCIYERNFYCSITIFYTAFTASEILYNL